MATKYKDNPYVWFDLQNEPGGGSHEQQWLDDNNSWSTAIRDTGAQNMISYEGGTCGQEQNYNSGNWATQSNFLYWGPQLKAAYGNVTFQLHVYGNWAAGDMPAFINATRSKGLAMFIGETGWQDVNGSADEKTGTLAAFAAAESTGAGLLVWHGEDGFGYVITSRSTGNGHFDQINSTTNPTNLTQLGQNLWSYSHYLAANAPQTPVSPTPTPTPISLSAGTYNDTDPGLTYNGGWQTSSNTGEYQGNDHYSTTSGDTMTMNFTGSQVSYWYSQGSHHGIANVSIDGKAATAVDLYAATRTDGTANWQSPLLTSGAHTLTITNSGNKNASSSDTVVVIDRIIVANATATPTPTPTPTKAPTPTPTSVPVSVIGDVTGDGHVTSLDLAILLSNWGR
jgi:hypothetical protein